STRATHARPTAPPPVARQSFTQKAINPHSPAEDQAKLRELFKTARNEGLFTPPSLQGTIQLPGHNGGANWGSSAVDPSKGTMYIFSKELPTYLKVAAGAAGRGGAPSCGGGGGAGAGAPAGGGRGAGGAGGRGAGRGAGAGAAG